MSDTYIVKNPVSVRRAPNINGRWVRNLSRNTSVDVIDEQGAWRKIGTNEWVLETYLRPATQVGQPAPTPGPTPPTQSNQTQSTHFDQQVFEDAKRLYYNYRNNSNIGEQVGGSAAYQARYQRIRNNLPSTLDSASIQYNGELPASRAGENRDRRIHINIRLRPDSREAYNSTVNQTRLALTATTMVHEAVHTITHPHHELEEEMMARTNSGDTILN